MWTIIVSVLLLKEINGNLLPFENYHLNATVGGYAVMNCHLDFPFGNEIPYQLEWEKDGELIFSWYSADASSPLYADSYGGRIHHLKDGKHGLGHGSINLTSVRETDHGVFHCKVLFPNRTPPTRNNGTFYFLEVEGGNLIITPPMNVTCLEGERAEFECLAKNAESSITWYKDGIPVADLLELAYRSVLGDNGSLIIQHSAMTDPGEYECHVRNPENELQSASAFLDVQYKAKVIYAPKERYLPYGKPASLDCHFSANPPLTNLRWEKDGFLFDPYNVPGVFYGRNGSLLFNEVDESHEGQYSCTPYNALGTEGASTPVKVQVQRPPSIVRRPQPLYLVGLGQSVLMPCVAADGNVKEPPLVVWSRKDGLELPSGRYSLDGGNMTLEDLSEEDRGIYVCTASNDVASINVEVELVVENMPPRAPYNLTARVTQNSIHLSWVPGYNGENVDYNIWYRERDVSKWRTLKITNRGLTEATLMGLIPGVEYEVRVLSQDHLGDDLFSKPLFMRTLDIDQTMKEQILPTYAESGGSLDPPEDLSARIIEEGVLLTWKSLSPRQRCAVRWYSGEDARLQGTRHTTDSYLLLSDITEDERYVFAVSCGGAESRVTLHVPAYSRLRTVAAVTGGVALGLAALALVLYFARDQICGRNR